MKPTATFAAAVVGLITAGVAAVTPAFAEFKRVPARTNTAGERPVYDKTTAYGEFMDLVGRCQIAITTAKPLGPTGLSPALKTYGQDVAPTVNYAEIDSKQTWLSPRRSASVKVRIYDNIKGKPVTFCTVETTKDVLKATGQKIYDTMADWLGKHENAGRVVPLEYPYKIREKDRKLVFDSVYGNARGCGMQFDVSTTDFGGDDSVRVLIVERRNSACNLSAVGLGGGL